MQTTVKPCNPNFSSGSLRQAPRLRRGRPAARRAGPLAPLGLGQEGAGSGLHRDGAPAGLPEGYRVAVVPASDTGAVEMAMWSLLGPRGVDVLAWESFGAGWVTDIVKQPAAQRDQAQAGYGEIVDLSSVNFDNDVVFTWNGTTGRKVPTATGFRPTAPV